MHDTEPAIVAALLSVGYQGMAIYVPALNNNGAADGQDAVNAAHRYSLPIGFKLCVDIEPSNFNRAGLAFSKTYSDAWHDVVRTAGFSPGPYGTPATVADCADKADYVWIAEPGQLDPAAAAVGSAFFPGRRMIQYGNGSVDGVSYDINHSQIALQEDKGMTVDDFGALIRVAFSVAQGGEPTPNSLNAYKAAYNGSNGEALITQILDDPKSVAYEQKRSAVIAAGPATQGPPGPPGPQGPAGPPGASPTSFAISGTAKAV